MKGVFIIYPSGEIECVDVYINKSDDVKLKDIQKELVESLMYCPNKKYETNIRYVFEEEIIKNQYCELSYNLYKYYYKKESGWVYNSYTEKKEHLFEIRVLKLKDSINEKSNTECQTDPIDEDSKEENETIRSFKRFLLNENNNVIHIVKKKIE